MKKYLLAVLIFPSLLFSQYYSERSTEQSFERSELFFKSHYLNTFGLYSFKNVTSGLVDDPFLNLHVNPASFPVLEKDNAIIYLDFRGDRTASVLVEQFVSPNYYTTDAMYRPWIDPRWNAVTRQEPEPIFSLGILTLPLPEITKDFFVGATYQIIHREEKFYNTPFIIYNSRYGYTANADKAEGLGNMPVIDRYSSKDEMITSGHLFSAFAGYKFSEKVNVGVGINGVSQNRNGGYLNMNNDEYGNTKNSKWENKQEQNRNQNYHHIDFNAGINYKFSEIISCGLTVGTLSGKAEQTYDDVNRYLYNYNSQSTSPNWSNSFSNSSTGQSWNHDGSNKYIGINFNYTPSAAKSINGYYRYTTGEEDFTSTSVIKDTSIYESQWIDSYNNWKYTYNGKGSAIDFRTSSGNRSLRNHEVVLSFGWKLNSNSKVILGAYWNKSKSEINNREPVNVIRYSEYHGKSTSTNPYNYDNLNILKEDKVLMWVYNADYWTFQIPVLLQYDFNENFSLLLGVNRILKAWEIHDVTTAYFNLRERNENGTIKKETNFGERYTQPAKNITENETRFITKFSATISSLFKINVMIEPEYEFQLRVVQWWLSFEGRL